MQLLFAYLLKISFCLALGYLFYAALLRRMTYYTWNRYFLLVFSIAALLIPAIPISLPGEMQEIKTNFFLTDALPAATAGAATVQTSSLNYITLVAMVMLAGMVFFFLRFAVRLYSLLRARSAARLVNKDDIKLYHLEGCTAPFSFYNSIYLDTNAYNEEELENIIQHERTHITQNHTIDTIVSELLCIIQWFNPFVWMMKHAIRQNLEFIADDAVLQKGINRKGYQYLLLKVSGAMPYSLANNLLFPSLKKRIEMMNSDRTDKTQLLKFIWIVPLACLLLFAFSGPAPMHTKIKDENTFSLGSLSFYINDENVASIVKNEQGKSFLKAGGPLSLALISEEKTRLKTLLEKNGYQNIGSNAISFVMDTTATDRSFSVQVTIKLDKAQKQHLQINKTPADQTAIKRITDQTDLRYTMASIQKKQNPAPSAGKTE